MSMQGEGLRDKSEKQIFIFNLVNNIVSLGDSVAGEGRQSW